MNVYVDLTREFNATGLNAILSSGQAVVLHRIAVMSKDGDWILRERETALECVLAVLAARKAVYRFGAPLDLRWMRGGWSAHLEFRNGPMRIRTDFVTRPPRLTAAAMNELWRRPEGSDLPFVDVRNLIELKKTNREKDYAVIGELARLLTKPEEQLLTSRSARDILDTASRHPGLAASLTEKRPMLAAVAAGIEAVETALDAERRAMIRANERRLNRYLQAATAWTAAWPKLSKEIEGLPLPDAHCVVVQRASGILPCKIPQEAC
ncbi:MAG: hypothetical protein ACLP9L_29655 [Thermoguttaceae bacterium]